MPPLTDQQKEALRKGADKLLSLAGFRSSASVKPSPERTAVNEIAARFQNYRDEHLSYYDKYKELKTPGFERIASFYLDTSGTPEGEEKNIAFLKSLATEEGKAKFAKKCASDILSTDLRKCMPSGDLAEDVRFYSEHAQRLEVCWVVGDLLNESKYLDPEVTQALRDRSTVYQSAGHYQLCTRAAANPLYPHLPELDADATERLELFERNNDVDEVDVDEDAYKVFFDYVSSTRGIQTLTTDAIGKRVSKVSELEKEGTVTPFTYAVDETGSRLTLDDAAGRMLAGKTVEFREDEAAKPILSSYVREAEKPITMPKAGDALYDTFSKEALSAQGKGFMEECARLSGRMDSARLWYTGGSKEFKNVSRLLKETASGSKIPNKEESLKVMNEILKNCEVYLGDGKHTGKLKPREQKRFDAVKEVRDSLLEKKQFLENAALRSKTERLGSERNGPGKEQPFHASERNQERFHTSEAERKAGVYLDSIRSLKGEDGVMHELAVGTESFVKGLVRYAANGSVSLHEAGAADVEKGLAEMALLEMIRCDRARQKTNGSAETGKLETRLEAFYAGRTENGRWGETVARVAGTKAVRQLAEGIRKDPANAEKFLNDQGYRKLFGEVRAELAKKQKEAPAGPEKEHVLEQEKKLPDVPHRDNGPKL